MCVFAPASITARVMPTAEAPQTVDIEPEYVAKVQERLGRDAAAALSRRTPESLPLEFYQHVEPLEDISGWFRADVCFASIGWVTIRSRTACTVTPRCVKGSLWAKRDQPMYPTNLARMVEKGNREAIDERFDEADEPGGAKRRLSKASREGRHEANRRRESKQHVIDMQYTDDLW
mmetsp:Transcript_50086/g.138783  ORF Transcript_50086/g.138783 Transcript_50086/m.138783 type:complete len:176 (+) Transcript_50086:1-528(+)